jgi:hypothetical protein
MKSLVFDTGPIISLAMNNLLWILKPMKERFSGEFYITPGVRKECIERPLTSKKFKFEALQVLKLLQEGIIKVCDNAQMAEQALELLELANSLFMVQGSHVKIVQYAEIESVVAAKLLGAEAVVVDEFITRNLIEDPSSARERMERKLHMRVIADKDRVAKFRKLVDIKVIRSLELVTIAYELNLFSDYVLQLPNPKKTLLEGLLWGIKLNGCSVSEQEIEEVIKIQKVS